MDTGNAQGLNQEGAGRAERGAGLVALRAAWWVRKIIGKMGFPPCHTQQGPQQLVLLVLAWAKDEERTKRYFTQCYHRSDRYCPRSSPTSRSPQGWALRQHLPSLCACPSSVQPPPQHGVTAAPVLSAPGAASAPAGAADGWRK